jgi:hypothetical protein
VNERIEAISETAGELALLCECADLDCTATIILSVAEYERIRSSSVRFPIALGHEVREVENVVEVADGYLVVQKRGKAAEVSAHLDPRTRLPGFARPSGGTESLRARTLRPMT